VHEGISKENEREKKTNKTDFQIKQQILDVGHFLVTLKH
jgi:hypothetical protein